MATLIVAMVQIGSYFVISPTLIPQIDFTVNYFV